MKIKGMFTGREYDTRKLTMWCKKRFGVRAMLFSMALCSYCMYILKWG